MTSDSEAALSLLRSASWLSGCHHDVPQTLISEGSLIRLASGRTVQTEGDENTGLMVLVKGSADFFCRGRDGQPIHLGQVVAGTAWGHTPEFVEGPRLVSVVCAEQSLLLKVPAPALTRIARDYPDVWRAIASLLYLQLRNALQWGADMVGLGPRERIAARLLATSRHGRGIDVLQMSQQSLAETVGLTRKTVNLHLADFQREGVVQLEYGRIRILDVARLSRLARG